MPREDDRESRELDRLLARGRMSGPEKDRVLAAVLRDAANVPAKRSWLSPRSPVAWAFASGLLMIAVCLPIFSQRGAEPEVDGFRPKGGAAAGKAPLIEAACARGCSVGGVLTFRVESLGEGAYFAAYAQGADGARIWYFPSPSGELPRVAPSEERKVLPRGARIGAEHAPGHYELRLFLLRQPLSREQIAALAPASATLIAASRQALEVKP